MPRHDWASAASATAASSSLPANRSPCGARNRRQDGLVLVAPRLVISASRVARGTRGSRGSRVALLACCWPRRRLRRLDLLHCLRRELLPRASPRVSPTSFTASSPTALHRELSPRPSPARFSLPSPRASPLPSPRASSQPSPRRPSTPRPLRVHRCEVRRAAFTASFAATAFTTTLPLRHRHGPSATSLAETAFTAALATTAFAALAFPCTTAHVLHDPCEGMPSAGTPRCAGAGIAAMDRLAEPADYPPKIPPRGSSRSACGAAVRVRATAPALATAAPAGSGLEPHHLGSGLAAFSSCPVTALLVAGCELPLPPRDADHLEARPCFVEERGIVAQRPTGIWASRGRGSGLAGPPP